MKTYLGSGSRLVRFAALRRLPMFLDEYPEHLRPLAEQFIRAAKGSEDRYTHELVRHKLTRNPQTYPDTWPRGVEREDESS